MTEAGLENIAISCVTSFGIYTEILETWQHFPEQLEKTREFLSKYKNKILIAHSKSSSTDECNIIIPCATYAESEGTVINAEGRMQRYFSVIPPSKEIRQSWLVLSDIYVKHSGTNTNAIKYDDWLKEISESMSLLKEIVNVAPLSDFRINGMKIPRQPLRYSGRTSVFAHINIHEPKPFEDENSSLTYSMEGTTRNENPALVTYNLKPGWNSAQSVNKLFEDLNNVAKAKSSGIKIWNKK